MRFEKKKTGKGFVWELWDGGSYVATFYRRPTLNLFRHLVDCWATSEAQV